jgi:serine/threonine protein phosphatase 1
MAEILYAISDIHGRLDMLERAYDAIVAHAAGRPARVVFLGDAIDRGPQSKGCVDRLIAGAGAANFGPQIDLIGNHEAFLLAAVDGDERTAERWLANGGEETLRSYGLAAPSLEALVGFHLPHSHVHWYGALRYAHETDTHIFVHAGLPPGATLAEALATEEGRRHLIWIRHLFLDAEHDFGKHIVHGHSPTGRVDFHEDPPFRTNIDSGVVYGGPLTIAVCPPGQSGRPERLLIPQP